MKQETKKLEYEEIGGLIFKSGNLKCTQLAYHRNGVSGSPFHVIHFTDITLKGVNFVGIVFEEDKHVAVFNRDLVPTDVRFFHNSYRGDYYENDLRDIIKQYDKVLAESIH